MKETKTINELINKMQKSIMPDQLINGSNEFEEVIKVLRLHGDEYTKLVLEYLISKILLLEKHVKDSEKVG